MDIQSFRDDSGYIYEGTEEIGRGGQGMVLATSDSALVLKLKFDKDEQVERDPVQIQEYRQKIEDIRRLPVDRSLHISMPESVLSDACGYVMHFLDRMSSVKDLMPNRIKEDLLKTKYFKNMPEWLQSPDDSTLLARLLVADYAQTGGLRLRLKILAQVAAILSALHGRGLVFGDISCNNVMVGKKWQQVFLIDIDNLCFQGQGACVFTADCCAPEVFTGKGVSIFSDCYAFAILAFELLTMKHPFEDGKFFDQDTGDFADDKEEQARSGQIPWVLDQRDHSNCIADTLFGYTLNRALLELFSAMFEAGRLEVRSRPPMWMFHAVLQQAHDTTVVCPHCHMGVIWSEHSDSRCQLCGQKLPEVLLCYRGQQLVFAHEISAVPYQGDEALHELDEKFTAFQVKLPLRLFGAGVAGNCHKTAVSGTDESIALSIRQINDSFIFVCEPDWAGSLWWNGCNSAARAPRRLVGQQSFSSRDLAAGIMLELRISGHQDKTPGGATADTVGLAPGGNRIVVKIAVKTS